MNAIVILAEITYWYRPKKIFNDDGQLLGYQKKFLEDILQKSYKQLSKKNRIIRTSYKRCNCVLREKGDYQKGF